MNNKTGKMIKPLLYIVCAACLILLMMYMGGIFKAEKIIPPEGLIDQQEPRFSPRKTASAQRQVVTEYYEAVGTVRPKTETKVEAQITGRILDILVRPGEKVKKGKTLIVLDDRESRTRLDQARLGLTSSKARKEKAKEAMVSSQAVFNQARSAYERLKTLFNSGTVTSHEFEVAESTYLQAKAGVEQAEEGLKEADSEVMRADKMVEQSEIALGYTRIKAPEQGEVVKRLAEPGDLAWPGKPLMILQTRGDLRLEAQVREGLIGYVGPGTELNMSITALGKELKGTVEEVVPSADPLTRTFLVKVSLPVHEGLFPGMFGRLMVPVEKREIIVIPKNSIMNVGQLEVVSILTDNRREQVFIKTGRETGDGLIEVLSGLTGDELLELRGDGNG